MQAGSADFSGLLVFTATQAPGVSLGDEVTLTGRYDDYFGTDELTAPRLLEVGGGFVPEPLIVNERDVAPNGRFVRRYDGMLVRVERARVRHENADAPADYDELELDSGLRIDDLLYPELDNTFPPGTEFESVSGILGFAFGAPKLWPRNAGDLVLSTARAPLRRDP
jgi:predicted extracellular nuclease